MVVSGEMVVTHSRSKESAVQVTYIKRPPTKLLCLNARRAINLFKEEEKKARRPKIL